MNVWKKYLWALGFLMLLNCGGAGDISPSASATLPSNSVQPNMTLNFTLTLTLNSTDDSFDAIFAMPENYDLPIHHNSTNATITVAAQDFPRLIYRICRPSSTTANCSGYSDVLGFDVDIVMDSCGRFLDNARCGSTDPTAYTGTWDAEGNIFIENVAMRTRIFIVTASESGFTASDQDDGFVTFNRTVVDLTTGIGQIGDLNATGSPVDSEGSVTLIATGFVKDNPITIGNTTISDTNFLGIITGTIR